MPTPTESTAPAEPGCHPAEPPIDHARRAMPASR